MSDFASDHDVLTDFLDLEDDEILTNWVVVYETKAVDGQDRIGYVLNDTCTPWNADGLLTWGKMVMKRKETMG